MNQVNDYRKLSLHCSSCNYCTISLDAGESVENDAIRIRQSGIGMARKRTRTSKFRSQHESTTSSSKQSCCATFECSSTNNNETIVSSIGYTQSKMEEKRDEVYHQRMVAPKGTLASKRTGQFLQIIFCLTIMPTLLCYSVLNLRRHSTYAFLTKTMNKKAVSHIPTVAFPERIRVRGCFIARKSSMLEVETVSCRSTTLQAAVALSDTYSTSSSDDERHFGSRNSARDRPENEPISIEQLAQTTSYNVLTIHQLAALTEYFCDINQIKLGSLTPAHLHDMHRLQMAWTRCAEQQQQQFRVQQHFSKSSSRRMMSKSHRFSTFSSRQRNEHGNPQGHLEKEFDSTVEPPVYNIKRLLERALADLACFWSPLLITPTDLRQRKKRMRFQRTQKQLQLMFGVTISSLIRLNPLVNRKKVKEDGLEQATELLEQMESTYYQLPAVSPFAEKDTTELTDSSESSEPMTFRIIPDNACYLAIIDGWAKRASHGHSLHPNRNRRFALKNYRSKRLRGLHAAEQSARVLKLMIEHAKNLGSSSPISRTSDELQHGGGGINSSMSSTSVVDEVSGRIIKVMPNTRAFNLVLNAWAEQGRGQEAEALLREMSTFASEVAKPYWATMQEISDGLTRPSAQARRRRGDVSSASSSAASSILCEPDLFSYNTALKAYAKSGAALEAERILTEMEVLSQKEDSSFYEAGIRPDKISYTTMIDALANSAANDPLEEEVSSSQHERRKIDDEDIESFSFSSNFEPSLLQAEQVLERMEERYKWTGDIALKPDTVAYNHVLNAISKSLEHDHNSSTEPSHTSLCPAARCEKLVEHMEHLYASGENPDVRPDTYSYNIVINTWANTVISDLDHYSDDDDWEDANERSPASRAEAILRQMEFLSDASRGKFEGERLRPNTVTYNSVIKAWSRLAYRDPQAPHRAEALLKRMHERCSRSGQTYCEYQPDIVTYNSVLYAWANSPNIDEATVKIQELFSQLTRNLAAQIKAKRGQTTGQDASEGHDSCYDSYGMVRPDLTSYNTVLNFWAKARRTDGNGAVNALQLLEAMRALSVQKEYRDLAPDTRSFTAVMNCISKSPNLSHKARKAKQVLQQLEESLLNNNNSYGGTGANVYAYSTLLNACAFTDPFADTAEKEEAMYIALETFGRIVGGDIDGASFLDENRGRENGRRSGGGGNTRYKNKLQANHVIYGTFLKACSLLMDGVEDYRRRPLVAQVFKKCCREGQVGQTVLEQLWFATDCPSCSGLYEELVGNYIMMSDDDGDRDFRIANRKSQCNRATMDSIPFSWKRNVRENRHHSLKQMQHQQRKRHRSEN